jgi:hypothetical protein
MDLQQADAANADSETGGGSTDRKGDGAKTKSDDDKPRTHPSLIKDPARAKENLDDNRPAKPTFDARPGSGSGLNEITFDDIKFDMQPGDDFSRSMLTDDINALNKTRVRIRGYIRPGNKECCFGPGAMIYDCVLVKLKQDETCDFTVRPITVEGEFFFKEYKGPDGRIWAVYWIKDGTTD